jgi:cell division protein FtsB
MTRKTQRRPPARRVAFKRRATGSALARRREPRVMQFLRQWASTIFVLGFLAVGAHLAFGESGFLAMRRMKMNVEKIRLENAALALENKHIAEQIRALRSDPQLIERIAREEMGLARPGEFVFKLPPKKQ